MINVGLVGFGLSGRYLQAPFFISNANFNLKSVVTSQEIPQELFPSLHRVASIDELLSDSSIDLISICSPNSTHFEYAKRSLNASKHVLIEKPMTSTIAEAEELIALAQQKNKVLSVFQNRRFDSDFLTISRIIESGILGRILSYEASYDRYRPELNSKKWKEENNTASGILYDLGSHLIDQAICLFGNPIGVEGQVYTQRENSLIDDAFFLRLDYGSIKVTLKSSLMVKAQGPRYVINGTKGSFVKYGLDIQEDQLRAGVSPNLSDFGRELEHYHGGLTTNYMGLEIKAKVETLKGNWMMLFDNLALAINQQSALLIKPEQVLAQLSIIERVKR